MHTQSTFMKSTLVISLFAVLSVTAHAQNYGAAKFHLRLDEVAGTYDIETRENC
jgi:hypothetical protein